MLINYQSLLLHFLPLAPQIYLFVQNIDFSFLVNSFSTGIGFFDLPVWKQEN